MSGEDEELRAKLVGLACQIVPYNMAHNAEAEACDLLMEIERLDLLEQYVDESAYPRVCLYLTRQVFVFRHSVSLNLTLADSRNTSSNTNLDDEEMLDAPGNTGNASMPEQVERPNPWRKMLVTMLYCGSVNYS